MGARQPKRLAAAALYDYAVRVLARRSLAVSELKRRLEQRAAKKSDVDDLLRRLKKNGYLDDLRLADSYAHSRRNYEGLGQKRVLRDLRNKGVDSRLAERAVRQVYEDAEEAQLIRRQLRRRLGSAFDSEPINDRKKLLSLYRILIRAGFSSGKIVEVLREVSSDNDWLDELAESQPDSEEEVFD